MHPPNIMLSRTLSAAALLSMAAWAQQPPDPAALMDHLEKQIAPLTAAWLGSPDARLQAWGAYLTLRGGRTEALPAMLALLAAYPVGIETATPSDSDWHDAMLGILDALIEFHAPVPAADAQRIYPDFPVQSLILLSRAQEDATPALLDIFRTESTWPSAWLAAGNLLLPRRAPGFAQAVIANLTVHALITVTEPGSGGGFGGSSSCCGASLPPKLKAGWPPVALYTFGGCGSQVQPGATLLAAGADPAFYHRQVSASYQVAAFSGCCNPDRDLVRQRYLAALISASADEPPVRAHISHTLVWQGLDAYRAALTAFIQEQQRIFAALAKRLAEQNLIGEEDVATLRPALHVSIWDQRAAHDPVLPTLASPAGNVTIEPFR